MIYVYAITAGRPAALPAAGHEDVDLAAVESGTLSAVVSVHDTAIAGGEGALWRHETVVEELMRTTAVLPMRFGTVLADEAAVTAMLERDRPRYEQTLERVRGRVELGLRVMATAEPPAEPAATSGREYLERLRRDRDGGNRLEAVHAALSPLAVESAVRRSDGGRTSLRVAYLVEDDRVEAFAAAVERLDAEHPDLALLFTGPWPPYSFVGDAREAEEAHAGPA